MAHFAQLDETNTVIQVIVISDEVSPDESSGQNFISNILKFDGVWKQTSYNTYYDYAYTYDDSVPPMVIAAEFLGSKHRLGGVPFRGIYANIGYTYDADLDEFVAPIVDEA